MVAKSERRSKILHYRRARIVPAVAGQSLESLMSSAVKRQSKWIERREDVSAVDKLYRFINRHRQSLGMLFGHMLLYAEGADHALVVLNDVTSDEVPLERIAPSSAKDHREFVDSLFYFGIRDNHVLVLQSAALRTGDFENHVNWLLHEADVIPKHCTVYLDEELPSATKAVLATGIKRVRIGADMESESIEVSPATRKKRGVAKELKYRPIGRAVDVLDSLLGGPEWRHDFSFDESVEESNLEVTVDVKYKRATTEDGKKMLATLARGLRNIDKKSVSIKMADGATLVGDQLRVQGAINVNVRNGLIDEGDLYPLMQKFLTDQIEAGVVPAKS